MNTNLRKYLQQNYNQITWKEKFQITFYIINALSRIHYEKAIHRDLHSGNILHQSYDNTWHIGDFGFCGPANKSGKFHLDSHLLLIMNMIIILQ